MDTFVSSNPETQVLHAGWRRDPATGAVSVPIYQTTCYQFDSTEHAADLFALRTLGNIYTRIMNPTVDALEKRVAALEGGAAALAVASGQSATMFSVLNLASAGDNIVSSTSLYGGTWNLFANTLKEFGIEVRFVDPADPEAFARATDDRTRAYYAETLPNPKLEVFPIAEVAAIGRKLGVPLIMDNTAAPILCRPLSLGAAVVMHSTTKWMNGHASAIGGIVVDGGNFDWAAHAERFPKLNTPDPSYHGAIWTEAAKPLGPIAYILRARTVLLRDTGAALSPFNAFQILQGIETLSLRMQRHVDNAQRLAEFLSAHPMVVRVAHPALPSHPDHALARTLLPRGAGAVFSFDLKGDRAAGRRFVESLQVFSHLANVGDARSLVIHPASTTHFRMDAAALAAAGITEGTLRLSVGLEDADDLISDLKRAFKAAEKA